MVAPESVFAGVVESRFLPTRAASILSMLVSQTFAVGAV
jgi:hypothetical protein